MKISNESTLVIDFLYLDLSVCTRCQESETNLDDSLQSLIEILGNIGHKIELNKIFIETEEQAIEHQLISSPTIRINGRDIQMEVKENYCATCSSLTDDTSISCRTWVYEGEEYSSPPQALIMNAILGEIYRENTIIETNKILDNNFQLPSNLKEYFLNIHQLCAKVNNPSETNESCCSRNKTACC